MLAVLLVFLAGLMIGRTAEYLQQKISGRGTKFVALHGFGIALAMNRSVFRGNVNDSGPAGPSW